MPICRSEVAAGEIGGHAMRNAFGEAGSICRPLRAEDGIAAAWVIGADAECPFGVLLVGLALEFTAARSRCQRRNIAKLTRLPIEAVRLFEVAWEAHDEDWRFDVVRRAIRITMARRCAERRSR